MEILSTLMSLCEGKSHVIGCFPDKAQILQSFGVLFVVGLSKILNKHSHFSVICKAKAMIWLKLCMIPLCEEIDWYICIILTIPATYLGLIILLININCVRGDCLPSWIHTYEYLHFGRWKESLCSRALYHDWFICAYLSTNTTALANIPYIYIIAQCTRIYNE